MNQKDMFKMRKIEALIEMSLPKSQPPSEIGEGPAWEERSSKPKGNRGKFNKNKKRNFKPRKPRDSNK